MTLKHKLEHNWLKHVIGDSLPFPRAIAPPYKNYDDEIPTLDNRHRVFNAIQYVDRIWGAFGKDNIYTAVYSDYEIVSKIFDKIYIDLDMDKIPDFAEKGFAHSFDTVYNDMQSIVYYLRKVYGYKPRVFFSGTKGFALYIDFPLTRIASKRTLRFFGERFITGLEAFTADPVVLGEISRISRVPFTPNVNKLEFANGNVEPQRLCIPIDPKWSKWKILKQAECSSIEEIEPDTPCDVVADDIIKIDKELKLFETRKPVFENVVHPEELERVQLVIKRFSVMNDGRKRTIHYQIVPRLILAGITDEQTIMNYVREFIAASGATEPWDVYERHTKSSIKRTLHGDASGVPWRPWGFDKFFLKFPELAVQISGRT